MNLELDWVICSDTEVLFFECKHRLESESNFSVLGPPFVGKKHLLRSLGAAQVSATEFRNGAAVIDVCVSAEQCLNVNVLKVPYPSFERRIGIVRQIFEYHAIQANKEVQEFLAELSSTSLEPIVGGAYYCSQTQKLRTHELDLLAATEMIANYDQNLLM